MLLQQECRRVRIIGRQSMSRVKGEICAVINTVPEPVPGQFGKWHHDLARLDFVQQRIAFRLEHVVLNIAFGKPLPLVIKKDR